MFRTPKAHKERKNHKYDSADKVPISAPEFHELQLLCMLTNLQQLLYDLILDNLIIHVNQQSEASLSEKRKENYGETV